MNQFKIENRIVLETSASCNICGEIYDRTMRLLVKEPTLSRMDISTIEIMFDYEYNTAYRQAVALNLKHFEESPSCYKGEFKVDDNFKLVINGKEINWRG